MGASASRCCSGEESVNKASEQTEALARKADALSNENVVVLSPAEKKPPSEAPTQSGGLFEIQLDKSTGTKLGIDVDMTDFRVEGISGGLMEAWNRTCPKALRVCEGDVVVEVNGIRGDVDSLVAECKKNKVLNLKIKRE
mmetsp:Transcript_23279/g.65008  ORF Transcript_23279/g.65008 Transcript_23279/m.65008 type:complete len:140 (+) Transcript_23279:109-528(+)